MWFQAIYLMTRDKKGVVIWGSLQRRVAHATQADAGDDGVEFPLTGWVALDDAYFGGERSGGKRGSWRTRKDGVVAAVETNEEGHPLRVRLSVVDGFRTTEIAAWAHQRLGTGTRVWDAGSCTEQGQLMRMPGRSHRCAAHDRGRCVHGLQRTQRRARPGRGR